MFHLPSHYQPVVSMVKQNNPHLLAPNNSQDGSFSTEKNANGTVTVTEHNFQESLKLYHIERSYLKENGNGFRSNLDNNVQKRRFPKKRETEMELLLLEPNSILHQKFKQTTKKPVSSILGTISVRKRILKRFNRKKQSSSKFKCEMIGLLGFKKLKSRFEPTDLLYLSNEIGAVRADLLDECDYLKSFIPKRDRLFNSIIPSNQSNHSHITSYNFVQNMIITNCALQNEIDQPPKISKKNIPSPLYPINSIYEGKLNSEVMSMAKPHILKNYKSTKRFKRTAALRKLNFSKKITKNSSVKERSLQQTHSSLINGKSVKEIENDALELLALLNSFERDCMQRLSLEIEKSTNEHSENNSTNKLFTKEGQSDEGICSLESLSIESALSFKLDDFESFEATTLISSNMKSKKVVKSSSRQDSESLKSKKLTDLDLNSKLSVKLQDYENFVSKMLPVNLDNQLYNNEAINVRNKRKRNLPNDCKNYRELLGGCTTKQCKLRKRASKSNSASKQHKSICSSICGKYSLEDCKRSVKADHSYYKTSPEEFNIRYEVEEKAKESGEPAGIEKFANKPCLQKIANMLAAKLQRPSIVKMVFVPRHTYQHTKKFDTVSCTK